MRDGGAVGARRMIDMGFDARPRNRPERAHACPCAPARLGHRCPQPRLALIRGRASARRVRPAAKAAEGGYGVGETSDATGREIGAHTRDRAGRFAAATPSMVASSSSADDLNSKPFNRSNAPRHAVATRLLPSRKGWLRTSPKASRTAFSATVGWMSTVAL